MDLKDIPTNVNISEEMRKAYSALNPTTPFSKWATARLWDAIEKQKQGGLE